METLVASFPACDHEGAYPAAGAPPCAACGRALPAPAEDGGPEAPTLPDGLNAAAVFCGAWALAMMGMGALVAANSLGQSLALGTDDDVWIGGVGVVLYGAALGAAWRGIRRGRPWARHLLFLLCAVFTVVAVWTVDAMGGAEAVGGDVNYLAALVLPLFFGWYLYLKPNVAEYYRRLQR
jgi:hypothetical protein